MEYFKGDETELKYYNSIKPISDVIDSETDDFFDECYASVPLGEVLFDSGRTPLSNAIKREIFISAFAEIFQAFVKVGTFEAYITVFEKIFGTDVDVQFTVPAAGKLEIDITAEGVELSRFIAREIEDNSYVYPQITTQDGDHIVFQSIKGFTSEYDLEQMLNEMVPAGVFTTITLTLLGA